MTRRLSFAIAAGLFVVAASSANAEKVIYQGVDAEKLKCAVMLSLIAEAGLQAGELKAGEYMMATGAVITLLDDLPGTPAHKEQAMERMAERLFDNVSEQDVVRMFDRDMPRCDRFFE